MYRFQVSANTQTGESIALVGSTPQLGQWDASKCVNLRTTSDRYPLWWADIEIEVDPASEPSDRPKIEYKYVLIGTDGSVKWESWGQNRWVPIDSENMIVDDGWFGQVQPWPYGSLKETINKTLVGKESEGLKIAVIGSSVALG